MSGFKFTKYYLDFIDDRGRGLIAYRASLEWRALRLAYEGILPVDNPLLKVSGQFSFKGQLEERENELVWESPALQGKWKGRLEPMKKTLFETPAGKVDWHCLQQLSETRVSTQGEELNGWGYAEKIEMTLPPWDLPIRELFWGRFVSEKNSVVWIRWEGPQPLKMIFFNSRQVNDCVIDENQISLDRCTLQLPHNIIRKEKIRNSLFTGFEKIARLFPDSILSLEEEKWHGMGVLMNGHERIDYGNIIHEKVCWP